MIGAAKVKLEMDLNFILFSKLGHMHEEVIIETEKNSIFFIPSHYINVFAFKIARLNYKIMLCKRFVFFVIFPIKLI